jgi:molecular chaperone HscB
MYDFSQNHFRLLGLEPAFQIDLGKLEKAYREIQNQVHPDRFAHLGDIERRMSMQWSTHVNEAYQTLKKPINRARYLLQLNGVETHEETNTAMPPEFLMQQMDWHEAIGEAKAEGDHDELESNTRSLQNELTQLLDTDKNYAAAAGAVRKLKFMEKLTSEVHDALEALES